MIYIKTAAGWRPIPSIASNQNDVKGVFNPMTEAQARAETSARAEEYRKDVRRYVNGEISKEQVFRAFSVPMYGAFGEKL